jgi:hypothetical protein
MTHPTRHPGPVPLRDAVAAISDDDMTRMCLSVNMMFGTGMANKLMELIIAARKEAK